MTLTAEVGSREAGQQNREEEGKAFLKESQVA